MQVEHAAVGEVDRETALRARLLAEIGDEWPLPAAGGGVMPETSHEWPLRSSKCSGG